MSQVIQQYPNTPNLTTKRTWSATDCYYVIPASVSYATGVINFFTPGHDMVTGDIVDVTSNIVNSSFTKVQVAITVVDSANFTIVYSSNPGALGYTEYINVFCQKYSMLMHKPNVVQVEALPAGTTIVLMEKVHSDATWLTVATITSTDGASRISFDPFMNRVRAVKTLGTGQPIIYSQGL